MVNVLIDFAPTSCEWNSGEPTTHRPHQARFCSAGRMALLAASFPQGLMAVAGSADSTVTLPSTADDVTFG